MPLFWHARRFAQRTIQGLPLPVNAVQFVIVSQQQCPHLGEEAFLNPLAEAQVTGRAGTKFYRDLLPLAAGSQNVDNAVQDTAVIHAGSSVFLLGRGRWDEGLYMLPHFIGNAPDCGWMLGLGGLVNSNGFAHAAIVQALLGRTLSLLAETPRRLSLSQVYDIDLRFCSAFEQTTLVFAEALLLPEWFGANADALFDVLNDLPPGRHVFRIRGAKRLDKTVLLKLKKVLASHREGGSGYSDGEAVFLVE